MALTGVLRPGRVALRVLELEPALKHYIDVLGLQETGRDAQGRVYLKAWDEHDHHSVVLREADSPGMDYMGFRVDSDATLERLAGEVAASGLAQDCAWIPAGEHLRTGRRFRFTIPTGHAIELFADKDKLGCQTGDLNRTLAGRPARHGAEPLRPLPVVRRRPRRHGQAVPRRAGFLAGRGGGGGAGADGDRRLPDLLEQGARHRLYPPPGRTASITLRSSSTTGARC